MARSDLVQANIDRARATSAPVKSPTAGTMADAAKAKEDDKGAKEETKKGPRVSDHRSILGANLAILQTLASIEFAPGNDGGMYKTTAYIELWSRGGDKKTQQEVQADGGVETPITYADLGILDEARDDEEEDFFDASTVPSTAAPERVEKLFGDSSTVPSTAATDANKAKQEALKEGTPTTAPTGDTPNTTTGTPVDPKAKPAPTKGVAGPIKPANPGGGIGGFFRKALGGGGKIGYGGNLTQTVNGSGRIGDFCTEKPQGVWQFLFNPEEIDWEGGPEYDEAQTWGVMGKTNSGKPLFWKNMKNERLTFSKVLLNGYVFGKQVGSLEEGLKDLFYREEGDNPAGPPVLNLIWGERTFGPCVIQDVRVKEKNWDNGILVNAEVSFSLVKIPEWIVNDGYVDVARPSAQPVNGDVFAAPGKADAPADPGGGGDTPPSDNKAGSSADAAACKKYREAFNSSLTLYKAIDPAQLETSYTSIGNTPRPIQKVKNAYSKYISFQYLYAGLYNKLYDNPSYKEDMTKLPTKCSPSQVKASQKSLEVVYNGLISPASSYGDQLSAADNFIKQVQFPTIVLQDCSKLIIDNVTAKKYNNNGCKKLDTVPPSAKNSKPSPNQYRF